MGAVSYAEVREITDTSVTFRAVPQKKSLGFSVPTFVCRYLDLDASGEVVLTTIGSRGWGEPTLGAMTSGYEVKGSFSRDIEGCLRKGQPFWVRVSKADTSY